MTTLAVRHSPSSSYKTLQNFGPVGRYECPSSRRRAKGIVITRRVSAAGSCVATSRTNSFLNITVMRHSNSIPQRLDPFRPESLTPDQLIRDFFDLQDIQTVRHRVKSITNMVVLSDDFVNSDPSFRSNTIFMLDTFLAFFERLNQKQKIGTNAPI